MKYAFSTLGCPEWSYDEIISYAASHGYQGVEFRGVKREFRPQVIDCFRPENRAETASAARKANVKLIGFGASASFHDAEKRDWAIEDGKAAIDLAEAMGMGFVRVFGDRIASVDQEDAVISRVIDGIGELCAYAKGRPVTVVQEVHGDFNIARRALAVAEGVNMPNFGLLWDVAHSDKTYGDGWRTFYDAIRPYIRHVHFKDHKRMADGSFALCDTGKGDIPLKDILKALTADGYDGYISLEWEKAWHDELRDPAIEFDHFIHYVAAL